MNRPIMQLPIDPVLILDVALDQVWHSRRFDVEAYIMLFNASMRIQGFADRVKPHTWRTERWCGDAEEV